MAKVCGAKTRAGTPCQRSPRENGRCNLHGGKSTGAPVGNQNAVKTGEYQSIFLDALTDEERAIFEKVDTDKQKSLDEQMRLSAVRIHRMLRRMDGKDDVGKMLMEDAITRTVARHLQMIDQKHRMEMETPDGDDADVSGFIDALGKAAKNVWQGEQAKSE